ncbi:MAG: hypothetical protein IPM39_01890 [Chloroflexi bacterium]|nr:hypothetical protein [Chloroflexota bacterium]
MREANRFHMHTVLILGEDEVAAGLVAVRPLTGGDQSQVPLIDIVNTFTAGS